MILFVYLLVIFLTVAAATHWFPRIAPAWKLVDIPNERSSHDQPKPRGAGLIFAAASVAGLFAYCLFTGYEPPYRFAIAALAMALIGLLDDLMDLSVIVRLIAHIAIAAFFLQSVSTPLTDIMTDFGGVGEPGMVLWIVALAWIVGFVSAFNFMDGIDGLAGGQAFVAGIAWAVWGYWTQEFYILVIGGTIAAGSAGFLIHNWHPSKVFMGDVGSSFLGFSLAAMPFLLGTTNSAAIRSHGATLDLAVAFIFLFLFDTMFTFIRRLMRKTQVWRAHREHLYQRITSRWGRHDRVTMLYLAFTAAISAATLAAFARVPAAGLISTLLMIAAGVTLYLLSRNGEAVS